ncbi:MAG: hypothetical protein KTR30_32365 [Saprospiraceae bacterium]|nr:hypothetical protein [Saprospiraceae bacterium]
MNPKEGVFLATKCIKNGKAKPYPEFTALAEYIDAEWGASLLNGDVFEKKYGRTPMCLRLIFTSVQDIELMPKLWDQRMELISKPFKAMLDALELERYDSYDLAQLDVNYHDFTDLAFQEVVNGINTSQILQSVGRDKISSIQKFWNYLTVFYQEDGDVERYQKSGLTESIKQQIQAQGRSLDEFGVLFNREIQVRFDTKGNFDRAGGGYNYYR